MQTGQILPGWNSLSPIANMEQNNGQGKLPDNALTTEEVTQIESTLSINQSGAWQQSTLKNETHDTIQDSIQTSVSKPELDQLELVAPMTNESTPSAGAMNNTDSPEVIAKTESRELSSKSIVTQPGATDAAQASVPESVPSDPSVKETGRDTTAWIHIGPDSLSNKTHTGQDIVPKESTQNNAVMYRKVSSLRELPDAVRKDLPRVVFSGHLYSSNPRSSVVFMDTGRPMKQGQEIADELYLQEITPTGVIVEFRGYLIDVGVLQNWTLN